MKYCHDYAPLLSAFVDGELSAEERGMLLAHLDECEACREYLCELEAMHAAFGEFEEAEVPEGFAARVLERAKDAGAAKKVARRRRFAPLAACAALFVFVSVTTLPWINAMDKAAAPESAAPGMMADMVNEAPKAAAEESAPEAEEDYFYYTENSVAYFGGETEKALDQEAGAEASAPEAPAPESGASIVFSDDELAKLREDAYILHGVSADTYLTGWGSEVADGLYCIDPALLKNLPLGLTLNAEDEARLYADEAPFVYVVAAEAAQ